MEKQLRLRARVSRPFEMYYIGIQDLTKYDLQDIESRAQDNIFQFTYSYTTLPCTQLSQSIYTFSISLPCLSDPVTSILAGDHLE
jgi:hypothetical protein